MNNHCELLIVSGPNGSGKSTLAEKFAKQLGYRYLGADKIAESLDPDDPLGQRIEASRQFRTELNAEVEERTNLVVETTLSGRTFVKTIENAKANGFSISVVHLFVDSAETCIARVLERVEKGGHDVPRADIIRRFSRSCKNFWLLYRPLTDRWVLLYNATTDSQSIAAGDSSEYTIQDDTVFHQFMQIVQHND